MLGTLSTTNQVQTCPYSLGYTRYGLWPCQAWTIHLLRLGVPVYSARQIAVIQYQVVRTTASLVSSCCGLYKSDNDCMSSMALMIVILVKNENVLILPGTCDISVVSRSVRKSSMLRSVPPEMSLHVMGFLTSGK